MTPLIALPALNPDAQSGTPPNLELPALTRLLHGATHLPDAADWRSGVVAALGSGGAAAVPAAQVAACAVRALPAGTGVCMATPVHVVAGISRMFLAPAHTLPFDADARESLRVAFNAEFGAPDVQLHAVGSGWVLQAPFASAASDGDPLQLAGTALAREAARTDAGRGLRRFGAEAEMWLAAQPCNAMREKVGAPAINCLWLWGGATSGNLPAVQRPGGLFSDAPADAWLAGLASLCGSPVQYATRWSQARDAAGAAVILQPPEVGNAGSPWPVWDRDWLAPAWEDLSSRQVPALRLQIGRRQWQLPAPRLSRWLRRARPWWQAVSA